MSTANAEGGVTNAEPLAPAAAAEVTPPEESGGASISKELWAANVDMRHQFARKVFGVIGCQLISMVGIAALVMMDGEAWVKASPDMSFTMVIASVIGVMCMLVSFMVLPASMLKRFPDNYVLLTVFTGITGIAVGLACLRFNLDSLLVGLGVTSFIVAALSAFACQTTSDFIGCGPYLFVVLMTAAAFQSMLQLGDELHMYDGDALGSTFKVHSLERTCGTALCVLLFIVFDVQLIMKGYHFDEIGPDDFVAAAIHIYVDPLLLCAYCLRLGKKRQ